MNSDPIKTFSLEPPKEVCISLHPDFKTPRIDWGVIPEHWKDAWYDEETDEDHPRELIPEDRSGHRPELDGMSMSDIWDHEKKDWKIQPPGMEGVYHFLQMPDYVKHEMPLREFTKNRLAIPWEKVEGINDFEQCEKAVILANNIAKESTNSELPNSSGFYWWRASKDEDWRMLQIIDFAADLTGEPPSLAAYDVELKAWSGRTLKAWKIHDPIGEWIECQKPKD